jgi:hypothetical protein
VLSESRDSTAACSGLRFWEPTPSLIQLAVSPIPEGMERSRRHQVCRGVSWVPCPGDPGGIKFAEELGVARWRRLVPTYAEAREWCFRRNVSNECLTLAECFRRNVSNQWLTLAELKEDMAHIRVSENENFMDVKLFLWSSYLLIALPIQTESKRGKNHVSPFGNKIGLFDNISTPPEKRSQQSICDVWKNNIVYFCCTPGTSFEMVPVRVCMNLYVSRHTYATIMSERRNYKWHVMIEK